MVLLGPVSYAGDPGTVRWLLRQVRFALGTLSCGPRQTGGGLTLEVAVDSAGNVQRLTFDNADPWLAPCVAGSLNQNTDDDDRPHGAALLRAGYVMTISE